MLDFIRIACAVPPVRVGDTRKNAEEICRMLASADEQQADLLVLPELSLTGYTCQDLFFQDALYRGMLEGLSEIVKASAVHSGVTLVVGVPLRCGGQMYNCGAVIGGGRIHCLVPKTYIPNYNEFYEKRWFSSGASCR
ncbi:MAG: nitrilase-related carbon-nitrogen hydrolase, partial [Candidatus Faecousia sp.]|nr:nitrilase-related carbon-nitrogen hydrolase [Candidatus Faecousia sp.]